MLLADQLSFFTLPIDELYDRYQTSVLTDISKRLARSGKITDPAAYQMERLIQSGAIYEKALDELAGLTGLTNKALDEAFTNAGLEAMKYDQHYYRQAGLEVLPLNLSGPMLSALEEALNKTKQTLKNLTSTTAITATTAFQDALDLAYMQVSTGTMSWQQAVKASIKDLGSKGLQVIHYESGRKDALDVAARRAVLTGVSQTVGALQITQAGQLGVDLVEVSAHPGARNTGTGPANHASWQGKIYSISGSDPKYPSLVEVTGYGTGPGLYGWNCRHDMYPYIEGVSTPAYTRDEVNKYNAETVKYEGREIPLYEATQIQRGMERNVRKYKRLAAMTEAAGDDPGEYEALARSYQSDLRRFTRETGLDRQRWREQVFDQPVKVKPTPAPKPDKPKTQKPKPVKAPPVKPTPVKPTQVTEPAPEPKPLAIKPPNINDPLEKRIDDYTGLINKYMETKDPKYLETAVNYIYDKNDQEVRYNLYLKQFGPTLPERVHLYTIDGDISGQHYTSLKEAISKAGPGQSIVKRSWSYSQITPTGNPAWIMPEPGLTALDKKNMVLARDTVTVGKTRKYKHVEKGVYNALDDIDKVIRVPDHGHNIPLKITRISNANGNFEYYTTGDPVRININNLLNAAEANSTSLHEFGHYIHRQAINNNDMRINSVMQPVIDALHKTRAHSQIVDAIRTGTITYQGKDIRIDRNYARYSETPRELFARAFNQYIANKAGNTAVITELAQNSQLHTYYPYQWEPDDFKDVMIEMDKMFSKLGWLIE